MKLRFNGVIEHTSGGCVPCGSKRKTTQGLVASKMYILPSGKTQTFYAGRVETVSDSDGEFLLSYLYTDKHGVKQNVFTKVD